MRKTKLLSFIAIFASVLSVSAFAHVTLLYPVGGETFQSGETVTIQWQIAIYHGPCNWDLEFSDDGGASWQAIVSDLPESALSYNWTVPNIETDSGRVKVTQDNNTGTDYSDASGNFTIHLMTGIGESAINAKSFVLYPAYPNPFNPATTIQYSIPESGNVKLKVYNSLGEEVAVLKNHYEEAGTYKINFNATQLSSGIYYYKIESGNFTSVRKMILLK